MAKHAHPVIDPFSRRQLAAIGKRFVDQRDEIERAAQLARVGMLCRFTDHELRVLWIAGFLCPNDSRALKACGRRDPSGED